MTVNEVVSMSSHVCVYGCVCVFSCMCELYVYVCTRTRGVLPIDLSTSCDFSRFRYVVISLS